MTTAQIDALIASITDNGRNTALKVRTVLTAIKADLWRIGEVREFEVDNIFITTNFDLTGLGTGDYLGFAICNGSNTTLNRGKRVGVGYDPASGYNILGTTGGAENVTLVNANIPLWKTFLESGAGGSSAADFANDGQGTTTGTPFSIMQPYLITLYIKRIA